MYTVAAIIVTHDRPLDVVGRAIGSVMCQIRKPDETIVVYTGESNDSFESLCSSYPSIRFMRTDRPASGAVGRNLGASSTECDYLAFLDDDDEWSLDKLKCQMEMAEDSIELVVSPYDVVGSDGSTTVFDCSDELGDPKSIIGENVVGCTSFPLVSRKAFNDAGGFDASFRANQEWDLWIRIITAGGKVSLCDTPAGTKHESVGSITSDASKRMSGWFSIIRKHFRLMFANPLQGARAMEFWWMEAYRAHRYPTAVVALSVFTILMLMSKIKR